MNSLRFAYQQAPEINFSFAVERHFESFQEAFSIMTVTTRGRLIVEHRARYLFSVNCVIDEINIQSPGSGRLELGRAETFQNSVGVLYRISSFFIFFSQSWVLLMQNTKFREKEEASSLHSIEVEALLLAQIRHDLSFN